jgi:uncharacterized damage-inducible protein DinB
MEATELLREQFKTIHQFMDMTVADCTPEVANKKEDSWTISKIGSLYAHVYLDEDMFVQAMGRGGPTLLQSDGWSEKLGISDPSPMQNEVSADYHVDLDVFREYAKAVAAATNDFLANATEEQLTKEVDTPVGKQQFLPFFSNIGLTHVAGHWGEIAALKGVQGVKGLPF